jgi:nucleoside-diphosphate-sugar epimerase
VHLAAIVGDPACDLDHQTARDINYAATCMILEVAKGQKVSRFIFASSCSVYGATDQMMYESSATVPISVYAQTKLDSEAAVLAAADSTFHPTVMRLATVFGNSWRPRFDLVVNLLTGKAHAEGVITIYNGEQWRPFIHVADVARGVRTLLDAPVNAISGRIFNLGDSRLNYTLTDVAEHIRTAFPNTTVHIVDNSDRRNYRVSFERARTILGFECKYDLDDGIRELKAALESGQIADYTSPRYHNQQYLKATGSPATRSPIDAKVMAAFASAASEASQAFTTA